MTTQVVGKSDHVKTSARRWHGRGWRHGHHLNFDQPVHPLNGDYTHAAVVKQNVAAALARSIAVVIGSSGLSAADYEEIDELARANEVGVVAAGNFSLTAALLLRFSAEAALCVRHR